MYDRPTTLRKDLLARVSRQTSGVSRRKRVRFADHKPSIGTSSKRNHASHPTERSSHQSINHPKTSEYVFYKKLLEDAGHGVDYCLPHDHDDHLKKSRDTDCMEELENNIVCNCEVERSVSPAKTVASAHQRLFSLPREAPRNSELQYDFGDIFPQKRQKLLRSAAGALSVEVDKFTTEGFDLISEFLQRLGIESIAKPRGTRASRLGEMTLNNEPRSLTSPESDECFERVCKIQRRDRTETTYGYDMDKLPLKCWDEESENLIFSPLDFFSSLSPTWLEHKTGSQSHRRRDFLLDDGRIRELHDPMQTTPLALHHVEITFDEYEQLTSEQMLIDLECPVDKSLTCYSKKKPFLGMDSVSNCHVQSDDFKLLGWVDTQMENGTESLVASDSLKLNLCQSVLSPPWEDGFDQGYDSRIGVMLRSPDTVTSCDTPCKDLSLGIFSDCSLCRKICYPEQLQLTQYNAQDNMASTEFCGLNERYTDSDSMGSAWDISLTGKPFSDLFCQNLEALLMYSQGDNQSGLKCLSTDFFREQQLSTHLDIQHHIQRIESILKAHDGNLWHPEYNHSLF
ncbi:hypothetical protein QJS04_geneDACA002265 [Acorus gramineus]|uniref:Uncharacterized protein n=1 Tax=Acorus gramineus TaxID=55184 RepID=A0AAV9A873_ACOGR|nr:hypothetical protein QJS04_geneDACA002265 [Acorus gramineus]